jgi:type VI secretion system secreted protein VgrG
MQQEKQMSLSACQSRLELCIGALPFPVLGLSGKEELNRPFIFHVHVLADGWAAIGHHLGQTASLTMTAPDGYERRVSGILTEIQSEGYLPGGQCIVRLTVESCLVLLRFRTDSRLIVSETLPAVIRQTLNRHNIPDSRLDFQLARQYPVRPSTLQAQEDDLIFVQRLAGRQGMLLWSEEIDGAEIIHLADTTNRCPMLARELLTYTPDTGMETTGGPVKVGMLGIADRASRVSTRHYVHDVHENAPEHPTLVGRSTDGQRPSGGTETVAVTFGSGAANEEEAKHQALIRAQRAATIRHTVEIRTHAADLRVGALIRLDTTGYSSTLSGDYLITAVTHKARQFSGSGAGPDLSGEEDCPYTNTAILIPRENPWRPELPKVPELPQIFSARVESRDPIPELDAAGRYRYRQYPDSNQAPHTEASAPARRLQPYASPSDGMPFGWHLPLHGVNEVLISCLNQDPDQPMLVGTLSNPAHGSVVTQENAHQNLLHTFGGNQLAMDDWRDKCAITLCTFAGHTMLHFNADVAGHRINLETGLGQMECYTKKTIATTSGDTLTETVGNDRIQQIENRQQTTTKQQEIHYQAKTDGEITAADNIQLQSGKNIELTAGQDLHLDITESTRIHVHEQDAIIHIDSGSLIIEADGDITIEGDGKGTMLFEQNGGGFSMAPNGDITIFGDEISLEADEINFYGTVNKEITAPPAAPAPMEFAPLSPMPIVELKSDGKSKPDLVIGVFFDGTKNNMLAQPEDQHTNVAKLLPLYQQTTTPPIYVQGVGTKAVSGSDGSYTLNTSPFGLGMGLGPYGGETRLKEAREEVWGALQKYHAEYGSPEKVIFDVFGFSRGAMLARHFVNMVQAGLPDLTQPPKIGQSRIFPDLRESEITSAPASPFALAPTGQQLYPRLEAAVSVRFLGIFDSVGSFYWPGNDSEGFINGHLAEGSADFVYHPVAKDEIRQNFPLTSIAPGMSVAIEEVLFGVHSDIGGGYGLEPERLFLGQTTYYQPNYPLSNLGINDPSWCDEMQRKAREIGRKNGIVCVAEFSPNAAQFYEIRPTKPDLSKVALKAMHDKAVSQGVPLRRIDSVDEVPAVLAQLIDRAQAGDADALKQLDDEYIHTSHRKLTVHDLGDTVGMTPAAGDVRNVFPNRPERAILL